MAFWCFSGSAVGLSSPDSCKIVTVNLDIIDICMRKKGKGMQRLLFFRKSIHLFGSFPESFTYISLTRTVSHGDNYRETSYEFDFV